MSGVTERSEADLDGDLFHHSRVPTITVDLNVRQILGANPAAERYLGTVADDLVGRPASDFLSEPAPDESVRRRGLRGDSSRLIRQVRTASGLRTAEINISPTPRDGVVFVQAFDIGDFIGDAPTPFVPDSDLGVLFDVAPVPSMVVDLLSGTIVRVNAAMEERVQSPARSLVSRSLCDFVTDPEAVATALADLNDRTDNHQERVSSMLLTASGAVRCELLASPLPSTPLAVVQFVERPSRHPSRRRLAPVPYERNQGGSGTDTPHDGSSPLDIGIRELCGWLLVTLGGAVLIVGWWLGVDVVTRIAPGVASMKANTAAGFIAIGAALLLSVPGRERRERHVAVGLLLAIGALTTVEYVAGPDLGIDELLAHDDVLTATSSPGRMGLNTAVAFTFLGTALLLTWRRANVRAVIAGQITALVAGGFALLALLAYTFGVSGGRGLASSTEMALHTTVGVIIATVGVLSSVTDIGILAPMGTALAGGRFARRILPVSLIAVVASGLLVRALGDSGVLPDRDFELAFLSLLISVSLFVVILLVADRSNQLDAAADRTRRDLATVLAAFSDRHFRVDAHGDARQVTGAGVSAPVAVTELVPPTMRDRLSDAIAHSRAEGTGTELTFRALDEDRRLELRVAPLPGVDVAVSLRDISELAAARDALAELTASLEHEVRARTEELRRTNVNLERSNADLEQFAYLASHDLQEPLRMVSTFVDKLAARMGDELDDRSQQYVEFAVDGAHRMAELIDGLLQYSRAGRGALTITDVPLTRVVADVCDTLTGRIAEVGATIRADDEMPSVRADEVLLRQVLQNLLTNALKFVDPDRPPEVRVSARIVDQVVELSVADNGIGIGEEFHTSVFHMFRRLHARTRYPGTGIGLALVQRLVESQDGTIAIDADHGPHGTRFVVKLPPAHGADPAPSEKDSRT